MATAKGETNLVSMFFDPNYQQYQHHQQRQRQQNDHHKPSKSQSLRDTRLHSGNCREKLTRRNVFQNGLSFKWNSDDGGAVDDDDSLAGVQSDDCGSRHRQTKVRSSSPIKHERNNKDDLRTDHGKISRRDSGWGSYDDTNDVRHTETLFPYTETRRVKHDHQRNDLTSGHLSNTHGGPYTDDSRLNGESSSRENYWSMSNGSDQQYPSYLGDSVHSFDLQEEDMFANINNVSAFVTNAGQRKAIDMAKFNSNANSRDDPGDQHTDWQGVLTDLFYNLDNVDLECPSLTLLTPNTQVITEDLYQELKVSSWERTPGTTVRVWCRSGLELVGPAEVTCYQSGYWSGSPYCRAVDRSTSSDRVARTDSNDEAMILLIVLIVILVVVTVVIIFICILLFIGRKRRESEESAGSEDYSDEYSSRPYEVAGPYIYDENIAMNCKYTSPQYRRAYDNIAHYEPSRAAHFRRPRSHSDASMEPLKLEELKSEKCPRVSAEDLLELGEFGGNTTTRSPTKKRVNTKPMLLVIDVRTPEEYKRGTVPGSLNIPFQTAFSPEGDLVPCPAVMTLNQNRAKVKVVVGSKNKNASNFANELVRLGYTRVCTLHKGIDVLRQTDILTVPPADI